MTDDQRTKVRELVYELYDGTNRQEIEDEFNHYLDGVEEDHE